LSCGITLVELHVAMFACVCGWTCGVSRT